MSELDDDKTLDDHLRPTRMPAVDSDYVTWKKSKITKALEQSKDRSNMIPASEVWDRLGIER